MECCCMHVDISYRCLRLITLPICVNELIGALKISLHNFNDQHSRDLVVCIDQTTNFFGPNRTKEKNRLYFFFFLSITFFPFHFISFLSFFLLQLSHLFVVFFVHSLDCSFLVASQSLKKREQTYRHFDKTVKITVEFVHFERFCGIYHFVLLTVFLGFFFLCLTLVDFVFPLN